MVDENKNLLIEKSEALKHAHGIHHEKIEMKTKWTRTKIDLLIHLNLMKL